MLDDEGRASVYNGRNRLAQLTRAGLTAHYQHNAFGERVSKPVAGASSQYVYDQDGHLVGEYAADGGLLTETIWLGDVPVAVLKPASFVASHGGRSAGLVAVFFVQPDQLDSPREIVNASNTPVWRWDSAPFGDTIANEQPSGGATPAFSYHLRFPGQQYDSESGLHYNYFRDYEPGAGRYVQSDPIGLEGGINTFVYVTNNPLLDYDLTGENGNSNSFSGTCHVYYIRDATDQSLYKVGESCAGKSSKGESKRCERQRRELEKKTGRKHECEIKLEKNCTKREIKEREGRRRVKLRECGCSLPGNREHMRGQML